MYYVVALNYLHTPKRTQDPVSVETQLVWDPVQLNNKY